MKKQQLLIVEDLIRFFVKIPENDWCVGAYILESPNNYYPKHCAIGHLLYGNIKFDGRETMRDYMCKIFNGNSLLSDGVVIKINDGEYPKYQQKTPKRRILKALFDKRRLYRGPKVRFVKSTKIEISIKEETLV